MPSATGFPSSISTSIAILIIAPLLYYVTLVLYRLLLHPISHIPGPKIAALTYLYEFYYDVWKTPGGQYLWHLNKLHETYGPILRINPEEVQINDPEFFDKIYVSGGAKRNRWPRSNVANGSPGSIASTPAHNLHRLRRSVLNPYFSRAAVSKLEDRLQSQVAILGSKLEECMRRAEIVPVDIAFAAFTMDVITEYTFGESWGCLTSPGFSQDLIVVLRGGFDSTQIRKNVPILTSIPVWLAVLMTPGLKIFFNTQMRVLDMVKKIKREREAGGPHRGGETLSIFTELLDSKLPPKEKEDQRLADEALVVVIAGGETTGKALATMAFHLLDNPLLLQRLQEELDEAIPTAELQAPLSKLERLPYLTAVIKESLRISASVTNRSLLTAEEPIQYNNITIPPGTPICMNYHSYLHNPSVFESPGSFKPDRWIGDSESVQYINKHYWPFSRGHRSCLGMNLAYAELYLTAAHVFRRFDMQLFDTVRGRDVDVVRDCFVGMPTKESKGVRVKLVGKRK